MKDTLNVIVSTDPVTTVTTHPVGDKDGRVVRVLEDLVLAVDQICNLIAGVKIGTADRAWEQLSDHWAAARVHDPDLVARLHMRVAEAWMVWGEFDRARRVRDSAGMERAHTALYATRVFVEECEFAVPVGTQCHPPHIRACPQALPIDFDLPYLLGRVSGDGRVLRRWFAGYVESATNDEVVLVGCTTETEVHRRRCFRKRVPVGAWYAACEIRTPETHDVLTGRPKVGTFFEAGEYAKPGHPWLDLPVHVRIQCFDTSADAAP